MQIEEALTQIYGPLLTITQLAKVLGRSAEGLRIGLRTDSDWVRRVNSTKIKLGRRIYFKTAGIAQILDQA
ncbi:DNA-binding protein [Undibacterium seohonense]|uniref:DNA-binding protein n=1 Tax=Undibacterium seohonense TaxID=1344950 RepID=A0ABR6X1C1_9BURK|nr:DNA-binding protein [Undibacterium seohonense]MBC3806748.1 DNA-binding protein [Undibacterium seohonense]